MPNAKHLKILQQDVEEWNQFGDESHVDILRQNVEKWNRWRQENPEVKPDLRGARLFRTYLRKANLTSA